MGALTDYRRQMNSLSKSPSSDRRSRRVSQRFDCDSSTTKKRARVSSPNPCRYYQKEKKQQEVQEHQGLAFHSSPRNISNSEKSVGYKLNLIPPPSPLKRDVQGPQRPSPPLRRSPSRMDESTPRVLTRQRVLEKQEDESMLMFELEDEWSKPNRCYDLITDFKALEDFKRRVDSLREKLAFTESDRDIDGHIRRGHEQGVDARAENSRCHRQDVDFRARCEDPSSSTAVDIVDVDGVNEGEKNQEKVMAAGKEPPLYKRLLEKTKMERDFKLKALDLEIELATTKLQALQLTKKKDPFLKTGRELEPEPEPEPDPEKEKQKQREQAKQDAFEPLSDDDEADVANAFKGRNKRKVLVMHENSNIEITREILQCLKPNEWLNDEVINLYLELLKEREKREPNKYLKCHFFNTFFYKKLFNPSTRQDDYRAVRRWTTKKKLGYSLTDCDKIFVPIHKEIHWCLAIIDMRARKFQYLDSLRGSDPNVLEVLARYIVQEAKDKTGQDLDVSTWEKECVEDLPAQRNGWDCGVFMIKYADFHSRGLPLEFSQAHMPYFRKRTAKEILELRAE
uniref:Ubiquitin-like protease family profile domain-containing protein n=1 Tax=Araucaria cunninghamii TaxID=56994 RepID=A0A0D6QUL2_ARACU